LATFSVDSTIFSHPKTRNRTMGPSSSVHVLNLSHECTGSTCKAWPTIGSPGRGFISLGGFMLTRG
jgi:hypothetical protein